MKLATAVLVCLSLLFLTGAGTKKGHSDGANCSAGNYPLGVDENGTVQDCTTETADTGPVPNCTGTVALQDADGTCITALTTGSSTDADALHTHDLKAPLADPALTGDPTVPTADADDNDTSAASTAYVQTEIGAEKHLSSEMTSTDYTLTSSGANGWFIMTTDVATPENIRWDFSGVTNEITVSTTTGVNHWQWGNLGHFGSSYLAFGKRAFLITGTSFNYAADNARDSYISFSNSSTVTINLPAGVTGMKLCVIDIDNTAGLNINPNSADAITFEGTTLSVGVSIQTASAFTKGDFGCLFAPDGANWYFMESSGNWEVGS